MFAITLKKEIQINKKG